jgi:hypothetical protein
MLRSKETRAGQSNCPDTPKGSGSVEKSSPDLWVAFVPPRADIPEPFTVSQKVHLQ